MSTSHLEEMCIPGPERDMDHSVFNSFPNLSPGFDVPSFISEHHGIPPVAVSRQQTVQNRLRAIQGKMIENDPVVQQILAGIIHERAQESKTPDTDALQKEWPRVRAELQQEFGDYDVRDDR